jgi:uncharacterized membrane protein
VTGDSDRSPWRHLVESRAAPLALFAVFAALIVLTIGRFSTWLDESASLLLAANDYTEIVHRSVLDVHPPLWYLVLKLWVQVFSPTILASRAESAVFMFAALVVWYHFVRTRFSRPLALLTLALTATNPMLLHYAVEGRMYALGVLLVALTSVFVTSTARWRWFAYWPCAVAMLYVHYFLAFPLAAQFVYLLMTRREQARSVAWIAAYGASIIAAFGVWIPVAFSQTATTVVMRFWIGRIAPSSLLTYVLHAFLHRSDGDLQNALTFPAVAYLAIWCASLIRAGRARNGPYSLLWGLVALPCVCLFLLSCKPLVPIFHPRYVIFGLPALITLLAAGALGFTGRWRPVVIVGLLLGHLAGLQMLYWRGFADVRGRFSMKEIAERVAKPIDGERPWVVATWVFGFSDARATLDAGQRVTILVPTAPSFVGDDMTYYGHPDWYITSWSDVRARHVWVIEDIAAPPVAVPSGWKLEATHNAGYARTRLFTANAP